MNDLHTPTGRVPIEEAIRFCINGLGTPKLSEDRDTRLQESEVLTTIA
jgi:hypothetical protein